MPYFCRLHIPVLWSTAEKTNGRRNCTGSGACPQKRARGYNQAELLARELAVRLQAPVYPHYLIRRENTSPQKDLNQAARMKNLKNAFKIGRNKIKLRRILLVDDIYTSGATIEACTRTLLLSGAEEVYYTSVAIGQGY